MNQNTAVTETLDGHFSTNVRELDTLANVAPCLFDAGVTMHIQVSSETESFRRAGLVNQSTIKEGPEAGKFLSHVSSSHNS